MKKMGLTLLTVVMVLSALSIAVYAERPATAQGVWLYTPYVKVKDDSGECVKPSDPPDPLAELCQKFANGNMFLETFEDGEWTGTFTGVSTENGKVVVHSSGAWSFNAIVSFSEVTVDGQPGTLEMSVVGTRPDANSDWVGTWVILRGTGNLATLRGQGTWEGPGAPAPGVQGRIDYEGKIHFRP